MDNLTWNRGESLLFKRQSNPFRRGPTSLACRHRQKGGEFVIAITKGGIRFAQTRSHDLAESLQNLVSFVVTVAVVECLEIIKIDQKKS